MAGSRTVIDTLLCRSPYGEQRCERYVVLAPLAETQRELAALTGAALVSRDGFTPTSYVDSNPDEGVGYNSEDESRGGWVNTTSQELALERTHPTEAPTAWAPVLAALMATPDGSVVRIID